MRIKLRTFLFNEKVFILPITLLTLLAVVVASSYVLAGWLMRPIADDYASLLAYHTGGLGWLTSLPHTVLTGGGRYGQTLFAVVLYGGVGQGSLHLTAIGATSLFIFAGYLAIVARQKLTGKIDHRVAVVGALIFFLLYSMLSVVFPWVQGHIDNSFQDFLWLPGFITYTVPFTLIVMLVSTCVIFQRHIKRKPSWLFAIGLVAAALGTMDEMIPPLFAELTVLVALYYWASNRLSLKYPISWIKEFSYLVVTALGLLIGLALDYTSTATTHRRMEISAQAASPGQLLHSTLTDTSQYFQLHVFGATATDHTAILFTFLIGMLCATFVLAQAKKLRSQQLLKTTVAVWLLTGIMSLLAVINCFAEVKKGYGIASYLQPRFEIIYNAWFCIFLLMCGFVVVIILAFVLGSKLTPRVVPLVGLVLTIPIILFIPLILRQASLRLETVAVFSHNWDAQSKELDHDADLHMNYVTVQGIAIGDGYVFNPSCSPSQQVGWIEGVEEKYYRIPHICTQQ